MTTKADYVRSQGQTRKHHCHWPGCDKQVPPAMWGCSRHWFKLPRELQLRIWSSYRPGQEIDGTPSANYIADAKAVQAWIAEQTPTNRGLLTPKMLEAEDAAGGVFAAGALKTPNVNLTGAR